MLHSAQALDPSGTVAQRTLGSQDQYVHLWADAPNAATAVKEAIPHSVPDTDDEDEIVDELLVTIGKLYK